MHKISATEAASDAALALREPYLLKIDKDSSYIISRFIRDSFVIRHLKKGLISDNRMWVRR